MIDTDSSGTLTYEELKDGLKKVGSDLGELDIKAMMKAVLAKSFVLESLQICQNAFSVIFYKPFGTQIVYDQIKA